METRINKQNPERNRDLLAGVIDEEQRSRIKHMLAEAEAKDAFAIGRDETHDSTNGAIKSGVVWA